jgi:predicted nucleic acid-binding protein
VNYLLDTNVLSETRKRNRNAGVAEWISTTDAKQMHLSALTIGRSVTASHNCVNGWVLVTRNVKDFDATGVRLLNPFTG